MTDSVAMALDVDEVNPVDRWPAEAVLIECFLEFAPVEEEVKETVVALVTQI